MLVPPPSLRRKPESRRLDPHDTELSPTRSIAGTIVIVISVNVLQLTGQGWHARRPRERPMPALPVAGRSRAELPAGGAPRRLHVPVLQAHVVRVRPPARARRELSARDPST